jgi:hypothetical protein
MAAKWTTTILFVAGLTLTLLNGVILVGQLASPVNARAAAINGAKLLEDEDFVAGLTKIVRKTVRDYCTVGKKQGIDC